MQREKTTLQSYGINREHVMSKTPQTHKCLGKQNHDGEITGTLQKDREIKVRESVREMREAGGATHVSYQRWIA